MIHKRALIGLTLLLLAVCLPALAQSAQDITGRCTIAAGKKAAKARPMTDRDYDTYYTLKKGGVLEIQSQDESLSGVFLQFYDRASEVEIHAFDGENWQAAGVGQGKYLCEYFPLPEGTRQVRVINTGKARMFLAELTLYGEGDRPARSPRWRELDKADMMLVVAHPDDELLWFGGLLPTYAGERKLRVQVVYLVPTTPNRRLELLDGLWHCGVDAYPLFAGMRDVKANSLQGQYKLWNRNGLLEKIVGMVRQLQPEVIVTQDENGEYGHGAHRVCADICKLAVKNAPNAKKYKKSAKAYGTWQVKKLYIHLYDENTLQMDWHVPLEAFGGKDGMTVASEALACHVSQVAHGWAMEEGGENDNSLFGLYHSTVGEDENHDDFMENIPLDDAFDASSASAGR